MSDDPARLFKAAGGGKTADAFQAEVERATAAQLKYRNELGETVLMDMANWHDWPELAAALIKRGCDVNAKDNDGITALHFAGCSNHRETARVLLEHGADRTIKANSCLLYTSPSPRDS